jgi:hypothetical protein
LKETLSKKFKNDHENFSDVMISIVWDFLFGCPKAVKFRDLPEWMKRFKFLLVTYLIAQIQK